MSPYTTNFYEAQRDESRRSAAELLPHVLKLIQPQRVIDVGCGVGTWLSVIREYGIEDVLGVDGDYVNRNMLMIPTDRFVAFDLTQPLQVNGKFDLVLSLEVAEHLPGACAETFVDSLTRLGPVILFSAAIPAQGGTQHINEQWQDYWVKLFQARGYVALDCIRKQVWQNENINVEYIQNMLLYVDRNYVEQHPTLKQAYAETDPAQFSVVHPRAYLARVAPHPLRCSLGQVLAALPILARRAVARRIKKLQAKLSPLSGLSVSEPKQHRV